MNFSFKNILLRTLALCLITVTFIFPFVQIEASTPSILSYQGRLTNDDGDLLGGASGTAYFFKFSFWDNDTINTGSRVWPTSAPSASSITVTQGVFNVKIGDTDGGYPDVLDYNFNTDDNVYLQVEVSANNVTFETLGPRQQITSPAYSDIAGVANSVSGVEQSSFGTTTSTANSIVTVQATSSVSTAMTLLASSGQIANIFNILDADNNSLFSINNTGGLTINSATSTNLFASFLNSTNSVFTNATSTNIFSTNLSATNFTLSNLSGILLGTNGVVSSISTSTLFANYYTQDESDGLYELLGTATSSITNHENIFDHDLIATALQSFTETDPIFMAASTTLAYQPVGSYLTSYTETDPIFMAASTTLAYQPIGSYLTSFTEVDPVYTAWDKSTGISITESQISDLQSYLTSYTETDPIFMAASTTLAYQPIGSYLTVESDPTYTGSSWFSTTNNSTDWDTSFGWGDHSAEGYLTTLVGQNISNLTNDSGYLTSLSGALLATGATTGATSQAQAFTNGIITGKIYPSADSTSAFGIFKADGTTNVLNVDTTNGRVGIGTTTPGSILSLGSGQISTPLGLVSAPSYSFNGDLDTGIYSPSAGSIYLATNGANYFQFSSSGNFLFPSGGTLRGPSGTASAPGYTFFSDSTMGIYRAAASAQMGFSVDAAERLTLKTGGNVGIGTTTPSAKLAITGTAGTADIFAVASSTNARLFTVTSAGNVGIGTSTPTVALAVVGNGQFTAVTSGTYSTDLNLTSTGVLTTSASDIRLKTNLESISDSTGTSTLDKVLQLKPYTFNWKSEPDGKKDIGLIAQDVENIFPEITFTNKVDGYKGVNYSRLAVILVSAIQELNNQVIKFSSYVVDGVATFTEVISNKITAKEQICIGETCVDEQILKELLEKNSVASTTSIEPEQENNPDPVAPIDPVVDTNNPEEDPGTSTEDTPPTEETLVEEPTPEPDPVTDSVEESPTPESEPENSEPEESSPNPESSTVSTSE